METTKPFWASRTLWINIIAFGVAMFGGFGIDLGLDPDTQLALVGGIMAVINVVLRFMTRTAVGVSSG